MQPCRPRLNIAKGHDVWRKISGSVSALAVGALVVLAGCGGADQATSAGTPPTSAATVPAPTTVAPSSTKAVSCADMTLSTGPTDLASEIKAVGLSCADAAALIGKVGPQVTPAGGPPRVESDGFVCVPQGSRGTDHGPPSAIFQCTSGAMLVSFVRS
jgi:hypothetical protein